MSLLGAAELLADIEALTDVDRRLARQRQEGHQMLGSPVGTLRDALALLNVDALADLDGRSSDAVPQILQNVDLGEPGSTAAVAEAQAAIASVLPARQDHTVANILTLMSESLPGELERAETELRGTFEAKLRELSVTVEGALKDLEQIDEDISGVAE